MWVCGLDCIGLDISCIDEHICEHSLSDHRRSVTYRKDITAAAFSSPEALLTLEVRESFLAMPLDQSATVLEKRSRSS